MPSIKELLSHTQVRAALGIVGVIVVASAAYYFIESRPPAYAFASALVGDVTDDVTGNGTVSPVENPDLAFAQGGRVTQVNVAVGDEVRQGELLASLDTGILSANLASAQARLASLVNGPRAVDLAGKQTAVAQAEQNLSNTYASLPATLASTAAGAEDAVRTNADPLMNGFNSATHPRPSFSTQDDGAAERAGEERADLKTAFDQWDSTDYSAMSTSELEAAIDGSLVKLATARQFFADLSTAANRASPPLAASDLAAISAGRSTVNSLISSLTSEKQEIANQKLAVQSAKDALALTQAGASNEDRMAAQASVDAAAAQLRQSEIIAPFPGKVASVSVKSGDVVAQNAQAVALIPDGNFEVDIFLSEIDVTKVHAGDAATVTLDAYGADTPFAATVGTVDAAPSPVNGVPSYKATLVFSEADPRVASGMHANAVIHAAAKSGVLTVPAAAIGRDANGTYVLKEAGSSTVRTPVVLGLQGSGSVEVLSGITAGDRVALITGR